MDRISPFPISRTKIIPPQRRAEIVTRQRLIEMLHILLNKKLILISAPAGYGKTSLLIDLAYNSEIPVCWLSLDVLDQDPQRFLSYLIACLREKFPAFGAESLAVLKNAVSIEKENEILAASLTNEMYQTIHEHFALVLDDYQFIDQVPEIQAFINRFIQLAGEHCHLIIATRILPSLADLHLLVARDQVGGLSLEDLTFMPDEIQAFFAQNSAETLSADDAQKIARITDGWITSISLTGLSYARGQIKLRTPSTRTGIDLTDYFSREILDKQSPAMRKFLLITSIFDEVDFELCQAVLPAFFTDPQETWKEFFSLVQKQNLFAIPMGDTGLTFRYNHLFQDFLQAYLQSEIPDLIDDVTNRLASYYKEHHEWEKAHFIYENTNNHAALVQLIEESGTYFISNGRIVTLENWLERLPNTVVQNSPRLLSLRGAVAHIRGETQVGISLLGQAINKFPNRRDDDLAVTLVRRAAAYRDTGEYTLALNDVDQAIDLTQNNRETYSQYNLAAAMRVKGMVLYRSGQALRALEWLERSLDLFHINPGYADYIPIVEMELGTIHHALGNSENAKRFYLNALKTWEETGNLGWQASLMNNLGVLQHYSGEYDKAFTTLESTIDFARRSNYLRTQALALSSLGDLLLDLGELTHARECFEQTLTLASKAGYAFLMFYATVAKLRIARLENQFALAETLSKELLQHIQQNSSPGEEAIFRYEYGCLLLNTKRPELATQELERSVNLYQQDGRALEALMGRVWLAAALIASHQVEAANMQLRVIADAPATLKESALLLVAVKDANCWFDSFKFPPDVSAPLQDIFDKAAQFSNSIPTLRRKLRQISHSAFISPPHLTIRAFGPAQVWLNGKKLSLSDWQTRETRDLFFYFLQSDTSTKENVALAFWPDISPARLKMRFKTNVYRLRHAVGQNVILFDDERYFFNRNVDYESDVDLFKKALEQANRSTSKLERKAFYKKAIDLVKGPYLSDVYTDWASEERNQLQQQYHDALLRLAELYLEDHQETDALAICQIAIKNAPLLEEAYRLCMQAYANQGDSLSVTRIFLACRKTLMDELGINPSRETLKLYQFLTKS